MSFLRPLRAFTQLTTRTGVTSQIGALRQFSGGSLRSSLKSAQGYGDSAGDPKAENPLEQGPTSEAQHNSEHPGPPPPSQGTGGATQASSGTKDPSEASANSGGSRSKEATETGSSPTGGEIGGNSSESTPSQAGARPKISDKKEPNEGDSKKQDEVNKHNEEFENRYDRATKA